MVITTLLSTLLSTFATPVPNLCDAVILDTSGDPVTDSVGQTLSRYCQWMGPDAPVWDANVCCSIDDDAAACSTIRTDGRCPSGTKVHYCEHGAADALGGVTCYQPLPSMCDLGLCVEAPEIPLVATLEGVVACCSPGGACQIVPTHEAALDCQGDFLACNYGAQNADGSVECYG